jgi:hypothetical protein
MLGSTVLFFRAARAGTHAASVLRSQVGACRRPAMPRRSRSWRCLCPPGGVAVLREVTGPHLEPIRTYTDVRPDRFVEHSS